MGGKKNYIIGVCLRIFAAEVLLKETHQETAGEVHVVKGFLEPGGFRAQQTLRFILQASSTEISWKGVLLF